jgi:hypothetical protein
MSRRWRHGRLLASAEGYTVRTASDGQLLIVLHADDRRESEDDAEDHDGPCEPSLQPVWNGRTAPRGQPPIPHDGRGEDTTGRIAAGCAGLTSTLDSARTIIDGTTSSADLPAAIQRSPKWRATRRSGPS